MKSRTWRARAEWAFLEASERGGPDQRSGAGDRSGFEDRLVGGFGWTCTIWFDDIEHWVSALSESSRVLDRSLAVDGSWRATVALPGHPDGSTYDGLGDAWYAAGHTFQLGVRVVALVRHYLPIWKAHRSDVRTQFGEFRGVPYAVVCSRHTIARWPFAPFGLFTFPDLQPGAEELPVHLAMRLDALEESLDRAGHIFHIAGHTLDSIRRRREPSRQRASLAQVAMLAERSLARMREPGAPERAR